MSNDCLGCKIAKKEINCPGGIVFQSDNFIVNQDYEIPIESFFIVESKEHKRSLTEFNDKELIELIKIIKTVRKGLKQLFSIDFTYIFQDENALHFHVWIFPQISWMNKIGKGIQAIPNIIEYSKNNPSKDFEIINRVNKMREYLNKQK